MPALVPVVVQWVVHQAALLPLAALLYMTARRSREYDVGWWLIAAGLAVSWVADSVTRFVDWRLVTYLYPPVQFGLIYMALLMDQPRRMLAVVSGVALLALFSLAQGYWHMPEVPTQIVGSAAAVALVWNRRDLGLTREGLVVYFGIGLVFWIVCALTVTSVSAFLAAWVGYQVARMAGLTLVTTAVLNHGSIRH